MAYGWPIGTSWVIVTCTVKHICIDRVTVPIGHSWRRPFSQSWLIHIIPDAIHALIKQTFVETPPPRAHLASRKIGKGTRPRPNTANERFATTVAAEVVIFQALLVYIIVVIDFRAGVKNRYQMEALFMQPVRHLCWMRKSVRIECEVSVAIHIIDIEPDGYAGMIACTP